MPDLALWGLFVVASLVLLLTPGPAVLYIVARSVAHAGEHKVGRSPRDALGEAPGARL